MADYKKTNRVSRDTAVGMLEKAIESVKRGEPYGVCLIFPHNKNGDVERFHSYTSEPVESGKRQWFGMVWVAQLSETLNALTRSF